MARFGELGLALAERERDALEKVDDERRRDALERDVAERVREARASLEEERSRLAALMADLSQSVVVCNLDGHVLLYNQRAKQELSAGPDGSNGELLGLGRSIYTVFDRALIEHALERLQSASRDAGGEADVDRKKLLGSAQFVTATRAGRLLRAHMSPVLGSDGQPGAQVAHHAIEIGLGHAFARHQRHVGIREGQRARQHLVFQALQALLHGGIHEFVAAHPFAQLFQLSGKLTPPRPVLLKLLVE